jgi:hypothetical protein
MNPLSYSDLCYLFSSAILISKLSIYLCSNFFLSFRAFYYFINLDYHWSVLSLPPITPDYLGSIVLTNVLRVIEVRAVCVCTLHSSTWRVIEWWTPKGNATLHSHLRRGWPQAQALSACPLVDYTWPSTVGLLGSSEVTTGFTSSVLNFQYLSVRCGHLSEILYVCKVDQAVLPWFTHHIKTRVTNVRFEVLTAVTMKNGAFWDVTLCGSCKNRRFGGT